MANNPGAKDSKGNYLNPAAAINAGLMKKKSGELITPAKIAAKVAGKGLAKATARASKIVGKDVSKPGTLEKLSQGMTQAEKRALAAKLKEANVKGKKGLHAQPTQAKMTIKKSQAEIDAARLAAAYAKSVKASKAAGLDPNKVRVTYKGKSMGYKG